MDLHLPQGKKEQSSTGQLKISQLEDGELSKNNYYSCPLFCKRFQVTYQIICIYPHLQNILEENVHFCYLNSIKAEVGFL